MNIAWLGFLAALVVMAVAAALAASRWSRPRHPAVDVTSLELPSGLVVFTSTDCRDCSAVMGMVRNRGVPVREVTFELEPSTFEAAGVEGVPLIVGISSDGSQVGQLGGVPSERRLQRLIGAVAQ